MLIIRKAQLDAIRDSRENDCAAWLAELIADDFPRDAERLRATGVDAVVRLGMEWSRAHGRNTMRDMYLYVTMMFMLGCSFDDDPQLPWAKRMLGSDAAIESLHSRTLEYLDTVAGEDNEHLIRALIRARSIGLSAMPTRSAADFEPRTVEMLESIYPTKFAEQGADATIAAVQHAVAVADHYQMPNGASFLAILVFMLGVGFDTDPVHPWIHEVLRQPGLVGDQKTQKLYQKSLEFVEQALR